MRQPVRFVLLSLTLSIAVPLAAQAQLGSAGGTAASDSTPVIARGIEARSDTTRTAAAPLATVGGAPMTGLRAGVHARELSQPSQPSAAEKHANLGPAVAMMGVGLAGLIVGAIVGGTPGTIIMVVGGVLGLKGLYDYLQ